MVIIYRCFGSLFGLQFDPKKRTAGKEVNWKRARRNPAKCTRYWFREGKAHVLYNINSGIHLGLHHALYGWVRKGIESMSTWETEPLVLVTSRGSRMELKFRARDLRNHPCKLGSGQLMVEENERTVEMMGSQYSVIRIHANMQKMRTHSLI